MGNVHNKSLYFLEVDFMADWYQKTGEEALRHFDVTTDGLSSEQAAERLKKDGENVLAEGKKKTVLQVFLGQFADLLVLILIAAAIVSMFSGNIESTIVIFAVILICNGRMVSSPTEFVGSFC